RIISDEETKGRKPPPLSATPKNEDILELTDMLNDDGSVTPLPQAVPRAKLETKPEPPPMAPFGDVEDEMPIYAAKPAAAVPNTINRPTPRPTVEEKPAPVMQSVAPPTARPADPASAPQP